MHCARIRDFVECSSFIPPFRGSMLLISIILEALVAIIAVLAARKDNPYVYGLAFTFSAYVLYDLARLLQWDVQGGLLSGLFLVATVTALVAVWGLYRQ
jgi:hypothetical protein